MIYNLQIIFSAINYRFRLQLSYSFKTFSYFYRIHGQFSTQIIFTGKKRVLREKKKTKNK